MTNKLLLIGTVGKFTIYQDLRYSTCGYFRVFSGNQQYAHAHYDYDCSHRPKWLRWFMGQRTASEAFEKVLKWILTTEEMSEKVKRLAEVQQIINNELSS